MEGLSVQSAGCYWDGTFGNGGHSQLILAQLGVAGRLFASDRDALAAGFARERFADEARFSFLPGTISEVCSQVPDGLQGFLWDLGVSTNQLKDAERGFSFKEDGPLDMRMDRTQELTAATVVNSWPEEDIANAIYRYGEERFSRRIAARIVAQRKSQPFETTGQLADICRAVYPKRYHRIDPATRTFQGLRILVNDELGELERTLPKALDKLAVGGRAVLISFHSLEDRIVKHCFRDLAKRGGFRVLTKKPIVADEAEREANPAARSAKLRVLVKEGDDETSTI